MEGIKGGGSAGGEKHKPVKTCRRCRRLYHIRYKKQTVWI
jgi:ribosomal protein L37E